MLTQAILFTDVNQVTVDVANLPAPKPNEVVVQSHFSCVSPGTELRCLSGQQPDTLPWPYIPGYALSGVVVDRGAEVTVEVGTKVVCTGTQRVDRATQWGGHISHAICREASLYLVPTNVELADAAVAPLAAIAYHGVRVARPALHEEVAVVGLGPIGQLSLRLYSLLGYRAFGADRFDARVRVAQAYGLNALLADKPLAELFQTLLPQGADIVVDATGSSAAVADGITIVKQLPWDDEPTMGGRYIIQGSYPGSVPIPYQSSFRKELTFLVPRNYQPRDLRSVLDLMGRGRLALQDLVSVTASPEDAPAVYTRLRSKDAPLLTALFRWI